MILGHQRKSVYFLAFSILTALTFFSCSIINEPVESFFDSYSNVANAGEVTYPAGDTDGNGVFYISSDSEKTFSFNINNPKKIQTSLAFEFLNKEVQEFSINYSDAYVIKQRGNKTSGTVTFSSQFLTALDTSNTGGKYISGKISIFSADKERSFGETSFTARTDSVPPKALSAMLQQTSNDYASENPDGEYILCFYLPVIQNTVHQNDLHKLKINDKAFYIYDSKSSPNTVARIYTDAEYTELSDDFYNIEPVYYALGSNSEIFKTFSGLSGMTGEQYQAVYYKTGNKIKSDSFEYTITLEDDAGLKNTVSLSNNTNQLVAPEITLSKTKSTDGSYTADELKGYISLKISHSGKYYKNGTSATADCGTVNIIYSVKDGTGKEIAAGTETSDSEIEIKLPQGTYSVKAHAEKEGYTESQEVAENSIIVKRPAIYFVSNTGSDSETEAGAGSYETPFATVNQAVTVLNDRTAAEGITSGTIYLLSDLTLSSKVYLNNDFTLTLCGYEDKVYTLSGNNTTKVIEIGYSKQSITIKNLIITDGFDDITGGAGIYISSQQWPDGQPKTVELINCEITNNTSTLSGTGIYINSDYALSLTDCKISGNTFNAETSNGAAGIEVKKTGTMTSLTIKNCEITDNTVTPLSGADFNFGCAINSDAQMLLDGVTITGNKVKSVPISKAASLTCAVYNQTGIPVQGKNIIKDNQVEFDDGTMSWRNIVMEADFTAGTANPKIKVKGSLAESDIGVELSSADISTTIIFTEDFAAYNPATEPSEIFTFFNSSYALGLSGGEAAFSTNSGSMGSAADYSFSFEIDRENIIAGQEAVFTITPTVKLSGTTISYSSIAADVTWNVILYSGSTVIATSDTTQITLPAEKAYAGVYTLYVSAAYKNITHDGDFTITAN